MASLSEELNWKDFLDPVHYSVPLHALRYSVCHRLCLHLDRQELKMYNRMVPNFGGLAELVGFDGLEIENMERAASPTKQLLDDWKKRPDLQPTVGRLMEFLAKLGREDTLTELHEDITAEVINFLEHPKNFEKMSSAPIQDHTVSAGPGYEEPPVLFTRQDVTDGSITYYDAYVCYNPSGDSSNDLTFVRELIQRFEKKYKFRLFVPYRDDLAGLNDHAINARIISERCRHMIVVLSPNFLSSPACEFQSTFAHALSPGARNKRIVPIKIAECPTPNILRIMACCDFTKKDLWDWSWERLAKSIMVQLNKEDFQVSQSPDLEGLIQSTSFDFKSLESGISSMPQFPSSGSPALSHRQVQTQPIISRPSGRQSPMETCSPVTAPVCSPATVPVASRSPQPTTTSERFKKLFKSKK
ncbi:hypothetical protein BsWGS_09541 [Bradybaena similaris]